MTLSLLTKLSGPKLARAKQESGGRRGLYGVGSALQISPTQALLIANRRVVGEGVIDLEDGADGFIFDSLDGLERLVSTPLARNEPGIHPRSGRNLLMVAYLGSGGFVPLGARLPCGAPHPAAGTGFAIATYVGYPAELPEGHPPKGDIHRFHELIQLRFDGKALRVAERVRFDGAGLIPGRMILNRPINNAIADDDGLVAALVGGPMAAGDPGAEGRIATSHGAGDRVLGRNYGCAFCRWQFGKNGWRPVDFVPVSGPDMAFEPSMVRDLDGCLLMAVRGQKSKAPPGEQHDGIENTYHHFRVYRSADNGRTWRSLLHLPLARSNSPVVLNMTAQGTPFLTANPYNDRALRNKLWLWPLSGDRRDVLDPVSVLEGDRHFGRPRPFAPPNEKLDNDWWIDHPIGATIRLGDGRWHNLLCFLVTDAAAHMTRQEPPPQAGLWIEEVADSLEGERAPWSLE